MCRYKQDHYMAKWSSKQVPFMHKNVSAPKHSRRKLLLTSYNPMYVCQIHYHRGIDLQALGCYQRHHVYIGATNMVLFPRCREAKTENRERNNGMCID